MICEPCREPHTAEQCVDAPPGRIYPWRHCACQHKQRTPAAPSECLVDQGPSGSGRLP